MKFIVTTDTHQEDMPWLITQLRSCYWGRNYTEHRIRAAMNGSLNFWLHGWENEEATPIGYARVVTDRTIFSSVTDLFVISEYQRRGMGRLLMDAVVTHPDVSHTNCILGTLNAEGFYKNFGFLNSDQFFGIMMKRERDMP